MTRNLSIAFLILVMAVVIIAFVVYSEDIKKVNVSQQNAIVAQPSAAKNESIVGNKKIADQGKQKNNSEFSYQEKINREVELNKLAVEKYGLTRISGKKLYEALEKKGITIDSDLAQRMQDDQMTKDDWEKFASYAAQLSTEEESFKSGLSQYSNFNELKSAFDQRMEMTGIYYGNDLLNTRYAYKGAKFEDIKKVLETGAALPENLIEYLIDVDDIDLAVQLRNAGYNINIGHSNDFRNMNAIESYAESLAINPYASSSEQQIASMNKLIDLGAPLKTDDGTRDALDFLLNGALAADESESEKLLIIAKELNSRGISMVASHLELLNKLKEKFPSLYAKYNSDFK